MAAGRNVPTTKQTYGKISYFKDFPLENLKGSIIIVIIMCIRFCVYACVCVARVDKRC